MSHPYADLPRTAFWKSAVAEGDREGFPGLYTPRFPITRTTRVATAGSCFAQHVTRYLRLAGVQVMDGEPAPRPMTEALRRAYAYDLFSFRAGNIYTARQMAQLMAEAADGRGEAEVWQRADGRFVDALRPRVEPEGLESAEEVRLLRRDHLARVADTLRQTDVLIFTLGLAEAWEDTETGRIYPVCPGVAGGTFDPDRHRLRRFRAEEIAADLAEILRLGGGFNPDMRLLLTVSPVPLVATATGQHVLSATVAGKSILRAGVEAALTDLDGVDYVPSYEVITHPASGGPFFEANLRSVSLAGVEKVMAIFLEAHGLLDGAAAPPAPDPRESEADEEVDDLICEELLYQGGR